MALIVDFSESGDIYCAIGAERVNASSNYTIYALETTFKHESEEGVLLNASSHLGTDDSRIEI